MRWFGGRVGCTGMAPVPAGARMLWSDPVVWAVGDWPDGHVRVVHAGRSEAVIAVGPCSATEADLTRLLTHGVPDSAAIAWSGAYTILRVDGVGRVVVWTDPAAACPLYTTRDRDGSLVWGSSSRALAAPAGGGVDAEWLAASLVHPTAIVTGRSAFRGVGMLPPGHRVTLTGARTPRLTPVWAPPRRDWHEAVSLLRGTLADAVRVRVADAVAASDLSGGLDSSTLSVLAARSGPVMAVTVHPSGVTRGGDLDHARAVATANPGIRHVLLPLEDRHLPFAERGGLPATDEPAPSSVTWAMLSAQLRLLAESGVDCHLTGDGGDTLFLPSPAYLTDLARGGRWARLLSDTQGWARLRRSSPWPLLATAITGSSAWAYGLPPWLTSHAIDLAAQIALAANPSGRGRADGDLLAHTRLVARTARTEAQLADVFGIAMHNPYLDSRVLDTVIGLPSSLRASPRAYKPLLSAVVEDLLPETVRTRGAKGVFASDHHRGLRANLDAVLTLAEGRLAGCGLIDPRPVSAEIRRGAAGLDVAWGRLEPLLAAEIWLRAIETAPPVEWTTPTTQARPA